MVFALIGNQNCGKTTLFNRLTGSNQHVGNFPGVTVDKKEGEIRGHKGATVVDLPGIYSLSPYTAEEVVTRDFLIDEKPDCIINIVDVTNIERNLYLTLQLLELNIPTVVALNMMDEMTASGGSVDIKAIREELGVRVVPISAAKNKGVEELVDHLIATAKNKRTPKRVDFCSGSVHRAIHSVAHLIEDHAQNEGIPLRFAATKMIEGDEPMIRRLALNDNELDILGHITRELEHDSGLDPEAALADMRYTFIEQVTEKCVQKPSETKEQARSIAIDRILTHKVFAIPIFLAIMAMVFWMTFGLIGSWLSGLMETGIEWVTQAADSLLTAVDVAAPLHSLIIDGIFAGVGSVLSFLPTIVVLFFFLSLLEDSGYMARVAFVMDRALRKIGLSGRSFVPMLIGFGCSVPAIMATRTLSSERDRRMTILLTPFMSCSAKLPIYAVFTKAFFPENGALVMITLYILGMVVGVLWGLILKITVFRGNPVPFVMELPAYRLPDGRTIGLHMWEKAKDFLKKAFTVIFLATIVIWVLRNFDGTFHMVDDPTRSILASVGSFVAPFLAPLGFGDWRAATALLSGLTAKEAVVSTLAVLTGVSETAGLSAVLGTIFTPLSAFSFLCFTLLYMPCVAALAAVKREMGSWGGALAAMVSQTAIAWIVSFTVFQLGNLFIR